MRKEIMIKDAKDVDALIREICMQNDTDIYHIATLMADIEKLPFNSMRIKIENWYRRRTGISMPSFISLAEVGRYDIILRPRNESMHGF